MASVKQPQNDAALLDELPNEVYYIAPQSILPGGIYLRVNRAGVAIPTPRDFHITRSAGYRYNVIHCAFRGRGVVSVHGQKHPIREGQCFLLGAQEAHEYWADPADPWSLVWVEFGGSISDQLTRYILNLGGCVFDGEIFCRLTEKCTEILAHEELFEPKISSIIYDMLMCMCARAEDTSQESRLKRSILNYIEENLSGLTLEKIAGDFGYNTAYFSTLFKQLAGISFSRYLQYQRINRACILLITTELSIEAISQDLGFYDTSHFTHSFKSVIGTTPSAYRKEYSSMHQGEVSVRRPHAAP